MLVQVGLECEAFVAAFARIVLEGRVRLHVGPQVGAVGECFAAVGTREWFLSSVRPHVALQEPGSAEGLAAYSALMLQVVGQHVHGQSWHGHIQLVAGWTLPGLLTVQTTVRLLVSAQIRGCGIRLATLPTHVAPSRFPFGRTAVCRAHPFAAVRLAPSFAGAPLAGSPAGASIRDEQGIDGARLQLRATTV